MIVTRAVQLFVAVASAMLLLVIAGDAEARKVRVRGGAQLLAQARFLRGGEVLELRGRLIDDAREPLERGWVEVKGKGGLDAGKARGCPGPSANSAPLDGGIKVKTSDNGELCLRWRDTPDVGTILLAFGGDAYHGAADLKVEFDRSKPQRLGTSLRFAPRPTVLDLDRDGLVVSGVLDLALSTAHASREGLAVELSDERGELLAAARTGGDGKVRLTVKPKDLGAPGTGKLILQFRGTEDLAPAKDEQAITRRAMVKLEVDEDIDPADPGDTTEMMVAVVATHDGSAVDGGVVEALFNGSSVGAATVVDGQAALTVFVDADIGQDRESVELALRYLPSAPAYRPGPAVTVDVPIAPPSILLRVLLTIVVAAAGVWVVVSWRRSKELPSLSRGHQTLTPGVHVVHSRRGAKAWKGTVVDAHEGHVLGGVRIMIRAPSLEGDGVLLETVTDDHGVFAFDLDERPDGAELVTHSSTHSEERKALPAGGTLRIALVTRRRALLRRFVSWARVRGRPYDKKPDPTPRHVRAIAREQGRGEVVDWARAVERAAFGPGDVDEAVETQIRDVEPGP